MHTALERIERFSQEMKELQRELFETSGMGAGPHPAPPIVDDPAALDVLSDLKSSVDDLRRMLFFYVNNLAMQVGVDPDRAIHSYRLRRATELLEVLSRPPLLVLTSEDEQMLVGSIEKFLDKAKAGKQPGEMR